MPKGDQADRNVYHSYFSGDELAGNGGPWKTGYDTDHLGNCDTGIGFLAGEAYVESGNQAVYKCEWLKKGVTALMKGKSSAQRLLYLSSKLNSLFTKDKVSISF